MSTKCFFKLTTVIIPDPYKSELSSQVKLQGSQLISLTGLLASNKSSNMVTFVRAVWMHLPTINDISLALLYHTVQSMKLKYSS